MIVASRAPRLMVNDKGQWLMVNERLTKEDG